jgi:hypothetical protein
LGEDVVAVGVATEVLQGGGGVRDRQSEDEMGGKGDHDPAHQPSLVLGCVVWVPEEALEDEQQ